MLPDTRTPAQDGAILGDIIAWTTGESTTCPICYLRPAVVSEHTWEPPVCSYCYMQMRKFQAIKEEMQSWLNNKREEKR